jgi:nucleoside-diphosphate-sugar epimerase
MKILVAGGAGYVGSSLVPKLLGSGYEVAVVDLMWFGEHLPPRALVVKKDIFNLGPEDLAPYQQVVFLAGLSNDPMAEYSPGENFIQNAAAPAYLAYIAKKAGVRRFVYACSCSVYGYTENELFDEKQIVAPAYPYGISKLQGEQAVLNMADPNFSVISLRKGTISGWSPRMRLDLIVNTMFKDAVTKKLITVNNPSIWRPIMSIEDATNAYVRAIEANEKISGIFNIASGNYTVGEVAYLVKTAVEEEFQFPVNLQINHNTDFRNYKVDTDKARNVLSFHPNSQGPEAIRSIVADLADNMELFSDWENPQYYNIQTFKKMKV